jgi:hypothetical protein
MARRNATTLPADVQAALLDAPDFLRELTHAALQEVREGVDTFVNLYNDRWPPEKNGFTTPSATRETW